jgi:hypothetical protein
MNTPELIGLAPCAEIFTQVMNNIKTTDYGEVGVSLKIHAGRIVNVTHTVSAQSLTKEGEGENA